MVSAIEDPVDDVTREDRSSGAFELALSALHFNGNDTNALAVTANWQYSGPTADRFFLRQSSYSWFVEVLQVPSPVGGLGFAAAPVPLAFVSVHFRLSSCLIRRTVECVVYSP